MKDQLGDDAAETVRYRLVDLSGRAVDIESAAFYEAKGDYAFNQAALATEEKYALVQRNYVQFESTLAEITLNNLIFGIDDWSDFIDSIQLVNGSLLNLLSSTKAYLDQVPQHLNDIFGKESLEATAFTKLTHNEFDARFEYRIISGLRNHLQHGDFPVKWLEFSSAWSANGGVKESCAHKIAALLSVDDLIRNAFIRAATRAELEATGQSRLDVKPLVRGYMSSIAQLHSNVRTSFDQKAQLSEERVRALIIRAVSGGSTEMPWGLSAVAINETGQFLEKIPVFTENIDRRKHLIKRSSLNTHMEKHFVSSEVATK